VRLMQAVDKIPSVEEVRNELSDIIARLARLGDKFRLRVNAYCQSDDAQTLGSVQASNQGLIFAHDRMTPL
jgi:hypothetical protein